MFILSDILDSCVWVFDLDIVEELVFDFFDNGNWIDTDYYAFEFYVLNLEVPFVLFDVLDFESEGGVGV